MNKIVGGLLVLPSAALIALLGGSRKSVIAAALLVAFVPLFVKDSTTESLGVLTAFWTICGLVLATSSNYSVATLLGMFVSLGLAVLSRPEALVLVPFGAILLAPKGENRLSTTAFALLTLATLIFVALRVAQMTWAVLLELSRGNTPQMASLGVVKTVILGTIWRNGAFWPSIFPVGVTLVALLSLFVRKIRRPAAILLGLGLVWIATSQRSAVCLRRGAGAWFAANYLGGCLGFEGSGCIQAWLQPWSSLVQLFILCPPFGLGQTVTMKRICSEKQLNCCLLIQSLWSVVAMRTIPWSQLI